MKLLCQRFQQRWCKFFVTVVVLLSSSAALARECKVNEVILSSRFDSAMKDLAVGGVIVKQKHDEFAHLKINDLLKGSGQRAGCDSVGAFCRKLDRLARRQGHMSHRQVHRLVCEENTVVKLSRTPADSFIGVQWGLNQESRLDIDAAGAWDMTVGNRKVVVAVVDTGVDFTHPDLAANMWRNSREIAGNGKDDDGNGYIDDLYGLGAVEGTRSVKDQNGHGTHVAGIIGAVGNNRRGVVGVNWRVGIMAIRFLDADGSGTLADALKGYAYIIAQKKRGVNVVAINNSWGGPGGTSAFTRMVKSAERRGIMSVCAAGNDGEDNDIVDSYPANISSPSVISVASVNREGNLSSFSNYGSRRVHIAAPGEQIASTYPGGKYVYLSGTSMATPFVTGAIALMHAKQGSLSIGTVRARLLQTGTVLESLDGLVSSGRMLNVRAAIE